MSNKQLLFGKEIRHEKGLWYVYPSVGPRLGPYKSYNKAYSEYRKRMKQK